MNFDVIVIGAGAAGMMCGGQWAQPCRVEEVRRMQDDGARFAVATANGTFHCQSLVIATGGLAVPQIGATPFGYKVAEQFGIKVIPPRPALVPLALAPETLAKLKPLAGNTLDATTHCNDATFRENVLLTHRGLSGPAILQISSYWQMQDYHGGKKQPIEIDLLPDLDAAAWLADHRRSRSTLPNLLAERLPRKFAHEWCALLGWEKKPLNEFSRRELDAIADTLKGWAATISSGHGRRAGWPGSLSSGVCGIREFAGQRSARRHSDVSSAARAACSGSLSSDARG